ncbi:MAG: nuclear transport factor 2 family protein [Trebonia sp.]
MPRSNPALGRPARQEISEVLALYCRSIDRMDKELMAAVFQPNATVRYPKFEGAWTEFVDWMWALHRAYEIHSHQMSNVIFSPASDTSSAVTESYVSASLWTPAAGSSTTDLAAAPDAAGGAVAQTPGRQTEVRARYLDEWSLADGRWAIDHRVCIVDFKTELAAIGLVGEGRRDERDPSYDLGVSPRSRAHEGAVAR